jgi:hypothetical protein
MICFLLPPLLKCLIFFFVLCYQLRVTHLLVAKATVTIAVLVPLARKPPVLIHSEVVLLMINAHTCLRVREHHIEGAAEAKLVK